MNDSEKIRLVLADDQPIVREGLRFIINAQPDMEVVAEARDGQSAIEVTISSVPDIVLMDIQMPNGNGIDATRSIMSTLPHAKVVLLTTLDVQEYVFDGIRAGAVGYLLKDTDTKELLDGIRWVYKGQAIYRTATASKAIAQVMTRKTVPDFTNEESNLIILDPLSEREIDVLQQMAYGKRNHEIANILHASSNTVKTHVHHILHCRSSALRTGPKPWCLRYARASSNDMISDPKSSAPYHFSKIIRQNDDTHPPAMQKSYARNEMCSFNVEQRMDAKCRPMGYSSHY